MSIAKYVKQTGKVIAGNDYKIFAAIFSDIIGATFSGNTLTALNLDGSKKFGEIQADWDSVGYNAEGTSARGFMSEQNLTARFSKKTLQLMEVVDSLRDAAPSGLVLIRKDGSGNYWISGIAPLTKMAANRPYLSVQTNFNSGSSIEEVDEGNKYEITFNRMSATEEYPLASALGDTITNGTADWVDFN